MDELCPLIVGRVSIEGVDMVRTPTLRRIFDFYGGALYPEICGIAVCCRSAPRKINIRYARFDLRHFRRSCGVIKDTDPLVYQVEQQGLLIRGEIRPPHTFGLNDFTVMAGAQHRVRDSIIQYRLLPLRGI